MEAKMEKIDVNVVKFEVKVEANKFNEALTRAYKKNVKNFNVPGFRKGKVPMNVVKQYYGVGVLLEDAVNFAIDGSYSEVLKENNIIPVDYPKIDVVEVGEGKDFVYTAEVTVYPEVELGEYKGLSVEKKTYEVTEEEVAKKLKEMQEKNARVESKEEGTVENGNIAVIDFKGFVDGEAFQGGEGHDYSLEIGSKTFIDTFEEQLVGAKVNDTVEVNVTFPEAYHAENLAGKPVVFNVKVNDVKVKEVPALDDEFAKDTTEFETLAELRADVKAKLEEQAKNAADAEMRNALVEKVSANTEVEVPEAMVQHQIDNMLMELNYQLQYQGLNLEQLLQMTGRGLDELREERRADAERLVKSSLVLEAIAEKENVEANDADVDDELEKMAAMYNMEVEKIKSSLRETDIEDIKGQIKIRKTLDLLVENATIA